MSTISHGKTLAVDYDDAVVRSRYHKNRLNMAWDLLTRTVDVRGARVYDYGCGNGVFMWRLLAAGANVEGCEPDAYLVSKAPPGTRHGNVSCLSEIPEGSIDVLVQLSTLAFVKDHDERETYWREAQRIVKPGGYLLEMNPNSHQSRADGRPHWWVANPETHPAFLKEHGFTEVGREFTGYYPMFTRWPDLHRITRWSKVARAFGFHSRGGRVYHPWRLMWIPQPAKVKRCTGYYSLARRA